MPRASRHADILVLIPACNEAGRIEGVLDALQALPFPVDIAVIDDGSKDDTNAIVRAHGATVLRHPINLGYGAALQTGYLFALRRGYSRLVQMDADGQHDAAYIQPLLDELDRGADLVLGSRFRDPRLAPPTSLLRRLGSRLFAWVVTTWTGTPVTDPTSGFQAMSRRAIAEVARDGFPEDYPDADVLVQLNRSGLKLVEVPVKMHPRLSGVSMHRGTKALFYGYKMLVSLTLLPVRRRSPYRTAS